MAELADALGSGPSGRKAVEVRVLLSAPEKPVVGHKSPLTAGLDALHESRRLNLLALLALLQECSFLQLGEGLP